MPYPTPPMSVRSVPFPRTALFVIFPALVECSAVGPNTILSIVFFIHLNTIQSILSVGMARCEKDRPGFADRPRLTWDDDEC